MSPPRAPASSCRARVRRGGHAGRRGCGRGPRGRAHEGRAGARRGIAGAQARWGSPSRACSKAGGGRARRAGELDGVAEEEQEQLAQLGAVGADQCRGRPGIADDPETQAASLGPQVEHVLEVIDQLQEVEAGAGARLLGALAGELEHVVDEGEQLLAAAMDDLDVGLSCSGPRLRSWRSSWEKPRIALSGVRSSWLMFARKATRARAHPRRPVAPAADRPRRGRRLRRSWGRRWWPHAGAESSSWSGSTVAELEVGRVKTGLGRPDGTRSGGGGAAAGAQRRPASRMPADRARAEIQAIQA
jgi:hypothetical protein